MGQRARVLDRTVRTGNTPVYRIVAVGDTVFYNTAADARGIKATVLDASSDGTLHLRLTTGLTPVVKNVSYGDQEDASVWYFPPTV